MPAETVARHRFAGRGDMGKATEDAAEVASHSWDDPKPVEREGQWFGPVGQQVGVNGDGELRASILGSLDGPHDVGLRAAFFPNEQGVALAGVPGLKFPNIGATVEVDQPVSVGFSVPHEGVVAFAERVSVVEVARCADEGPELVG